MRVLAMAVIIFRWCGAAPSSTILGVASLGQLRISDARPLLGALLGAKIPPRGSFLSTAPPPVLGGGGEVYSGKKSLRNPKNDLIS